MQVTDGPAGPGDDGWHGSEVESITLEGIRAVLDGRTAYLVVRGYLDAERCGRIVSRFFDSNPQVGTYGVLPTLQIGRPLMPVDREDYFSQTREFNAAVNALYEQIPNQATRVREEMERATGWKTLEFEEKGRPYCTSLVVAFPPGAHIPLHVDRSSDIKGLSIHRFPRQLSWNVYLQPSEGGGELVIYDRTFATTDGEWKTEKQGGLHLRDSVLAHASEVRVRFRTGDFVLFDANRYHTVTQIHGSRRRVYVHGFVSLDPELGEMSFWT
jgi:hypothetical protein